MKNWLLLFFSAFAFTLFFQQCGVSTGTNNKPEGIATVADSTLVINWIRDGNAMTTSTTLDNVRVVRKRSGMKDDSLSYCGQSIQIHVRDGDELLFTKNGKADVHLRIDAVLHLTHIGVAMFDRATTPPTSGTIEGRVMGRNNAPIRQLPITINGQGPFRTDSTGYYQSTVSNGNLFTIHYSRSEITTERNAIITANTTNGGGRVVIDVAFDEDGKLINGE